MLFTAPAFIFLFLPLSVLFLTVFGKSRRRAALLTVFAVFHVFLYAAQPFHLLYPLILILYCYGAVGLIRQRRFPRLASFLRTAPVYVLICLAPYAVLVANHLPMLLGRTDFVYPTGLTVSVILSTAYLTEWHRERGTRRQELLSLSLYLLFFPIKIVGPLPGYSRFCALTGEEELRPTVASFADGIRIFSVGLIKRIAIAAPLMEGYRRFVGLGGDTSDAVIGVYLLILIYFSVFFAVTGYLDMGVGIATMLGVRLERRNRNPFRIHTPLQYMRMLFGSLFDRVDEWIPSAGKKGGQAARMLLCSFLCTAGVLFLLRPAPSVLVLSLPLVLLIWLCMWGEANGRGLRQTASKVLSAFGTVMLFAFAWVMMTLGNVNTVLDYVTDITVNHSEYHLNLILNAFSPIQYLFIIALMLFVLHPRMAGGVGLPQRAGADGRSGAAELTVSLVLLALLLLTLVFFLPQYAIYNHNPFTFFYS